jgi:alpha-ketoglutarate-dependent taurine dioxygenase
MLQSEIEVVEGAVAGQQRYADGPFPSVRLCRSTGVTLDEACAWVAENRERLVAESAVSGTVMFRGFPLRTAEDFDRFVGAFGLPNFAYEDSLSNAVRINKTPRVFTANEAPPDVTIFFHHEMAQTPIYPSRLFFFCEQPAAEGGATPLCRSDVLWERLVEKCPQFARDCEVKGLRYSNVMPAANDHASGMGRSWQSTLKAQTPAEAETRLGGLGYSWTWQDDGCLRATTPVLKAVYDLGDGRKSFFNQLIAAFCGWKDSRNDPSKAITLGDGTPLDRDAVMTAVALAEELAFDVPWQQGDVALVDNYVVMHGRRTFSGTRKVLASLVAA